MEDSLFAQKDGEISHCGHSNEQSADKAYKTLLRPYGGAIYSENSNIYQKDVTISKCTANYGGAIYLAETSSLENNTSGKISNCTAREDGGAIYSREIYFPSKDNFIKLHDSSITNCSATSTDKIFCNPNKPIGGGAIYIDGFNPPKTKKADIINSTIKNRDSCKDGGAIIACGNSSLSLDNNSKIINCTSKNESIGKGNAIYTDYNAKLAIDANCAIRFNDKCKINTNKDNGEQKYKHKGIFDEKLDKNNTPKVDNNNPHPFKITSPDYYEISSKNEYKHFDTITVYGTGTPGYNVEMKKDNTQEGIVKTKVDNNGNWNLPINSFDTNKPLKLCFYYKEKDNNTLLVEETKSIKFLKLHDLHKQYYFDDCWICKKFKAPYFEINTYELSESMHYKLFGTNTYLHECSQIDTNYYLPIECCPGFNGSTYYYYYDPSQKQNLPVVQYIDNISFNAITKYDKSIISDISYLKTDKLYRSHVEIPKNANWITPQIKTTQLKYLIFLGKDTTECTYIEPTIELEKGKLNDKFYIYAKFKDIFNNIRYVRFDGLCLIHKDIEVKEDKITKDNVTYEKLTKKDKELSVTLNGNTLCGKDEIVRAIGYKKEPLKKDIDYKIKNNKITIMQDYLNKLKDTTGSYFTIYYNPAGETNYTKAPHTIYMYTKKPDKVKVADYKYSNSTTPTISRTEKKDA